MDNPGLGRKVLDFVTEHPKQFDMDDWGRETDCGTVGCLAGHTMLQAGYEICDFVYLRPDGSRVGDHAREAASLLGLTEVDRFGEFDDLTTGCLFSSRQPADEALARFRSIVEASEAAKAVSDA